MGEGARPWVRVTDHGASGSRSGLRARVSVIIPNWMLLRANKGIRLPYVNHDIRIKIMRIELT